MVLYFSAIPINGDFMKKCFKCGIVKSLHDFYRHAKMADGRLNKCKECTRLDVRNNQARVGNSYDESEIGVIRVIYKTQKANNKKRGHGDLPYTKKELSSWLYKNGFKDAYDKWVESGFLSEKKPSVDRINSLVGYCFENIELVEWGENIKRQALDISCGRGSGGLRCKRVIKMDSSMNVIRSYVSFRSAMRDCGYSMEYHIKNGIKCKMGYYWKYEI